MHIFCLANTYYDRSIRRRFYINKGILSLLPRMALFMFLFGVNNMVAPLFLNLLGEIPLINRLVA